MAVITTVITYIAAKDKVYGIEMEDDMEKNTLIFLVIVVGGILIYCASAISYHLWVRYDITMSYKEYHRLSLAAPHKWDYVKDIYDQYYGVVYDCSRQISMKTYHDYIRLRIEIWKKKRLETIEDVAQAREELEKLWDDDLEMYLKN